MKLSVVLQILSLRLCFSLFANGQHAMQSSHYGVPLSHHHPMLQDGINSFGQAVLQYMASIQRQQMSNKYRQPDSEVPIPYSFGPKRDDYLQQVQPRMSNFSDHQNSIVGNTLPRLSKTMNEEDASSPTMETTVQQAKIYKHIYVHSAPEEPQEPRPPMRMKPVFPLPEKHYRILFIKAPSASGFGNEEIEMPPPPEQRTLVYVLLPKSTFGIGGLNLAYPKPRLSKPEVYFIRYKGGQHQQELNSEESQPAAINSKASRSQDEWRMQQSETKPMDNTASPSPPEEKSTTSEKSNIL